MTDWAETTLGDVITLEYGKSLPEDARDGVGVPVFGSNGIVGYHSQALVDGPGIVVGRKGTAGSVTYSNTSFYPIDTTYFVRLRDDRVSMKFVLLLLEHCDLKSVTAQTGVPGLNRERAYGITVKVPPAREQRRIVDLIAALDAQIAALVAERDAAASLAVRARLALLTTGLMSDWHAVSVSPDAVFDWCEDLPAGWSAATISAVCTVRSGATPRRAEKSRYFDGGDVPWVKTGDLNEGVLLETDECITPAALAETSVRMCPADTVLVAMYGGFGQIGRTARLAISATTNQAISALTDVRSDVSPAYLHEALKAGRLKWRRVAASSRKDPNISKKDVEQFDFPLPPIEEQRQIVDILDAMQSNVAALSVEMERARSFRNTVVSALLSTRLSLPPEYDRHLVSVDK